MFIEASKRNTTPTPNSVKLMDNETRRLKTHNDILKGSGNSMTESMA